MPGLPIAIVPHPVAKLAPDGVAQIADAAFEDIVRLLEGDAGEIAEECKAREMPRRARMRYRGLFSGDFNAPGAAREINGPDGEEAITRLFYQRGWTDGLPIVPPTPARWDAMLGGRDPDEDLGLIEPRLGRATVGNVAANAVMAGCTPEMLPVVIAATRAMADPAMNLKALQSTTHPCALLAIVSGPIAEELDINGGTNAMGQGVHANAAIGRAVRFVLLNVGGGQPGVLDRSTMGSPAKFSFCFAENEEDSPFPPLRVEMGFGEGDSTVTLCGVEGPHNVNDHYSETAEEVLTTIAGTMATPGCNNSYLPGEYLVVIGPEHAEVIARDGWSRADVQAFLHEHAVIPRRHISRAQMALYRQRVTNRFRGDVEDPEAVGVADAPEKIQVIVAGGAGRHSAVIPSFGNTAAVTVKI